MPTGTGKFRLVSGLCQISWLPFLTNQRATRGAQQVTQRFVELRRHSGDGWLGFAQCGDLEE
jgi:hypothetical protein